MATVQRWVQADEPEMKHCHAIRREVFILEQSVPEELEMDEADQTAHHLLLLTDDGHPMATARMLANLPDQGQAKVGRVAVLPHYRGRGLALKLMKQLESKAVELGLTTICLDAQVSVVEFYRKLGYGAHGPIFIDAGIEHRRMSKNI